MAIAKVILNGEVQMDVTSDTVEANKLLSGETATKNDGTKITGTFVAPDPVISSLSVTPTESEQTFNEASISGYKPVTVGAIASDYVGSAIPIRSSEDVYFIASQARIPSGYYSTLASAAMPYAEISKVSPYDTFDSSTGRLSFGFAVTSSGYANTKTDTGTFAFATLSAQTITPTESTQYISSYRWLTGSQTIEAIASDYVGSAIPIRSAANMYANGSRVYAPSGYYSTTANAAVSSTSLSDITMAIISSTGNVTAELSYSTGYLTAVGTKKGNKALPTLSASTWTPGSTSQIISSYRWLTGSQTIAAIPSSYIIPSGTYSVTENGTYDIGSYASVDVSVSGGDDYGDIIIQRQLSTISTIYSNDRVITIGLGALAGMSGITSFDFPNVTSVGSGAFSSCKSLKTINLPNLTYLGTGAFSFCTSLTDINMPAQSIIRNSTFMACYSLSTFDFQSVTSIMAYAFHNCSGLTSVDAPLISASNLGSNAFYGCNHLTTVSMPNITSIPQYAFGYATRLESIYMPNVFWISTCAFASCTKLASIDLPNVWYIGSSAFYDCLSLTSVGLSKTVSIFDEAFASTALSGTLYLPSLETIGSNAFANTKIESVDFPKIYALGPFCFYSCSLLTSISIPKCTIIGEKAFLRAGLPGIKLPVCSSIGRGAFQHASSLSWVFISGTNPLTIQNYAFAECTSLISIYLLNKSNYAYLLSSNAFDSSPFRYTSYMGFLGSIFVRESMYSRYVTAPDWHTVSGRFVSLTDNEIDPIIHCGSVVHAGQMVSSSAQYTMYAATDTFSYYLTEGSTYVLFDVLKYKDTNASYHLIANTPGVSFVASVNESLPHKSTGDVTYAVGAAFDHAAFLWRFPDSITDVSEVICDYTICEYNA